MCCVCEYVCELACCTRAQRRTSTRTHARTCACCKRHLLHIKLCEQMARGADNLRAVLDRALDVNDRQAEAVRHRHRHRHRQTQTDTDRHRQTQTDTDRHTHKHKYTCVSGSTRKCQHKQTHKGTNACVKEALVSPDRRIKAHAHTHMLHRDTDLASKSFLAVLISVANVLTPSSACQHKLVETQTCVRVCACACVCVCVCPSARWARAHASAASARRPTPPNHAPSADCRGPGVRQTSS